MVLCNCRIYEEYRRTCEWLIFCALVHVVVAVFGAWVQTLGYQKCLNINIFGCHCRPLTLRAWHVRGSFTY